MVLIIRDQSGKCLSEAFTISIRDPEGRSRATVKSSAIPFNASTAFGCMGNLVFVHLLNDAELLYIEYGDQVVEEKFEFQDNVNYGDAMNPTILTCNTTLCTIDGNTPQSLKAPFA
jgi:hypothetical protein